MPLDFNCTDIKDEDTYQLWREPYPDEGNVYEDFAEHQPDRARIADGPNGERIKQIRVLNPITNVLVFATMTIGIGAITEATAGEFWARLSMYERLGGALCATSDGPRPFTKQDIYDHIGLKTNVSEETRTKWIARIIKADLNDSAREFERFAEKAKVSI
jgi:hypothetical protein